MLILLYIFEEKDNFENKVIKHLINDKCVVDSRKQLVTSGGGLVYLSSTLSSPTRLGIFWGMKTEIMNKTPTVKNRQWHDSHK